MILSKALVTGIEQKNLGLIMRRSELMVIVKL